MSTHVNQFYPGLWLGDIFSPNQEFIDKHNISCIINCTVSAPFPENNQVKFKLRVPVKDNRKLDQIYLMYQHLDVGANFIAKHLPNNNILIHCHAGRQRSISVLAAFFMKYGDMTKNQSIDCIRTKKLTAGFPKLNFDLALLEYEKDLQRLKLRLQ